MTPEELKAARAALKLTQEQLAEAPGVRRETVARWEIGSRSIPEPAARLLDRMVKEARSRKRKK